tara:strand:- start:1552 stop:1713 length:162 start_codon:yes stop_codon:yes gene_type:complete
MKTFWYSVKVNFRVWIFYRKPIKRTYKFILKFCDMPIFEMKGTTRISSNLFSA